MITRTVDLCIIGGAGAGMSAAIVAKQKGIKNVLLIEKQKNVGGCTVMSAGMMGINTPVQKRFGKSYSVDEAFKDLMLVHNWRSDAKMVRKWLAGSGENFEWLEELGVKYDFITTESAELDRFRNLHHRMGDWDGEKWKFKMQGPVLVEGLKNACDRLGVEIMTETRAQHLLQDEKQNVTGVMAERADGETVQVVAKAVILATGSISSNKELVRRFYGTDEYKDIHIMAQVPHNTGDGFLMAEEVGAAAGRIGTLFIGPHNHYPKASELVGMLMRRAQPIKVNIRGERFVDESMPLTYEMGWMQCVCVDAQPGKKCYIIMDQNYIDSIIQGTDYMPPRTDNACQLHNPPKFGPPIEVEKGQDPTTWRERVMAHLAYEEQRGTVKTCHSLQSAADFIGCSKESLEETIAHYNLCCYRGHDDEFLKDPKYMVPLEKAPYYVIRGESGIDTCLGGLKVDHQQRVLRKDGSVISGLYAAGVMCSGWFSDTYCFFGSEMSYVIYSGRQSAARATEYMEQV